MRNVYDHRVDFPIPESYGVGLVFIDGDGNSAESVYTGRRLRPARREITSWAGGLCFDAKHFYGAILVSGLSFIYTKIVRNRPAPFNLEIGRPCDISGSMDEFKPREMLGLHIEVTRPITDDELDTERWLGYEKGYMTGCFNSAKEVKARIREVFRELFSGQWALETMAGDILETMGQS